MTTRTQSDNLDRSAALFNRPVLHFSTGVHTCKDQKAIGDMVREAYEKRAEAIRLEDEAQEILMNELTGKNGAKGE